MPTDPPPSNDWRRAIDGIWSTLERIADAVDERGAASDAPSHGPRGHSTPQSLADELGHDDDGVRVRRFLRDPDDGDGPFAHRRRARWVLDDREADRVRRRFGRPA